MAKLLNISKEKNIQTFKNKYGESIRTLQRHRQQKREAAKGSAKITDFFPKKIIENEIESEDIEEEIEDIIKEIEDKSLFKKELEYDLQKEIENIEKKIAEPNINQQLKVKLMALSQYFRFRQNEYNITQASTMVIIGLGWKAWSAHRIINWSKEWLQNHQLTLSKQG